MNSNMQTNTDPAANRYWKSTKGTERRKRRKEERGKREQGSYSFIKSKFKDFSMFKG